MVKSVCAVGALVYECPQTALTSCPLDRWQRTEWKTEAEPQLKPLQSSPSPQKVSVPPAVQPVGGARLVKVAQSPCISCGGWRPGPWTGLGPVSFGSGPGACRQTSWRTCSCTSASGQSGPGLPSAMLGMTGKRGKKRERSFKVSKSYQDSIQDVLGRGLRIVMGVRSTTVNGNNLSWWILFGLSCKKQDANLVFISCVVRHIIGRKKCGMALTEIK